MTFWLPLDSARDLRENRVDRGMLILIDYLLIT